MINSQQVLTAVQNGQAAPTWNVLPARKSFFISNFIAYLLVIIAGIALIAYLLLNSNVAIVPSYSLNALDDAALAMWRTIDMVFFPLGVLVCALMSVLTLQEMKRRHEQLLVLLPEGVLMHKGKVTRFITFRHIRDAKYTRSSLTTGTLNMIMRDGQKTKFKLDNRFGSSTKLLKQIAEAHKQYKVTNGIA